MGIIILAIKKGKETWKILKRNKEKKSIRKSKRKIRNRRIVKLLHILIIQKKITNCLVC